MTKQKKTVARLTDCFYLLASENSHLQTLVCNSTDTDNRNSKNFNKTTSKAKLQKRLSTHKYRTNIYEQFKAQLKTHLF